MNIRFNMIDIENFRSIQKATVPLHNQGIVIVKGVNEYEDKATSNGSGKSSIFEAIVYALFEETSSGEKDVANRIINNGFSLKLDFDIDGISYTILRQNNGNKANVVLYKDGLDISARNKTDTNKLILSILGISKNLFLDSVFLSQNLSTNLASLSPTARKERLEILTNTDYMVAEFKDKLKTVQAHYESECIQCQMDINSASGEKNALETQYNDLQQQIQTIMLTCDITKIQPEITQTQNLISQTNQEIEKLKESVETINQQLSNIEQDIQIAIDGGAQNRKAKDDLEIKRQNKLNEYNSVSNQISNYKVQCDMHKKSIDNIKVEIEKIRKSDTCPVCGRKYDNANDGHIENAILDKQENIKQIEQEIQQLTSQIEQLNINLTDIQSQGVAITQEIVEISKLVDNDNAKVEQLNQQRQQFSNELSIMHQSIQTKQNMLVGYEQQLSKLQSMVQKYETITELQNVCQNIQVKVADIDNKVLDIQVLYDKSNEMVSVVKHCIQLVTKEFRTYLLKNSIDYLNVLLKQYSTELFSNEKDVIKIEGDDTKLNISLGNATYESLSGGERTRVNIALLLAQKSLASIIGNTSYNMIILDEILGYCDSQAESNVISLITAELDELESIYMVSHKELPIGYDTELLVVKEKSGLSRVVNN